MRKGWLTPGWSRSWVAAARRPKSISQEVRDLASYRVNKHETHRVRSGEQLGKVMLCESLFLLRLYLGLFQITVHRLGHVRSMDCIMVRIMIVVVLLNQNWKQHNIQQDKFRLKNWLFCLAAKEHWIMHLATPSALVMLYNWYGITIRRGYPPRDHSPVNF